ncbi:hypothetical protein KUTeg_017326 [Tegillarca granosa]|uniref:Ion transport domain-containing protein n=1 Tax=Tegillarca granosa TaxID=220873 RepID=A0ABQ9EIP5_TEGGR|nr:hypothetical protein KUTeg_017326 [Tegillarca granosa]
MLLPLAILTCKDIVANTIARLTCKQFVANNQTNFCFSSYYIAVWDGICLCVFCRNVYAWVSIAFVLFSIFSFCAETHPLFHVKADSVGGFDVLYNVFTLDEASLDPTMTLSPSKIFHSNTSTNISNTTNAKHNETKKTEWVTHPALLIIDLVCVSYFSLEFLARFIFCPRKLQFITALQNIIDFVAIVPDYVIFILQAVDPSEREALPFVDFILILRMLRLCRIFRLIRHVPGLWILLYTLKASVNELMLMFVFLLIGMVVFASLMHFAESEVYNNIPIGFWWSVVTMTTVGYGDMFPKTFAGYIIGSICAISGLLMIAFTVPIIVSNFVLYYTHVQYGMVQYDRDKSKMLSHVEDEHVIIIEDTEEKDDKDNMEETLQTTVSDECREVGNENDNNPVCESPNHSMDGNCNKVN